jgi:predicted RNA-binding Zn-ribbon protein involved in translation (DUF1610 family)
MSIGTPESNDNTYTFVLPNTHLKTDTRHNAIGIAAKHGLSPSEVHPIRVEYITRLHNQPEHIGNTKYNERNRIPTTAGVVSVETETLVRKKNGATQEVVKSSVKAKCPICFQTHTVETKDGEPNRSELVDKLLECCNIEWIPPADYLDPCPICNHSHREKHKCRPLISRDQEISNQQAECNPCGWTIDSASNIPTVDGSCPNCGSAAVSVVADKG